MKTFSIKPGKEATRDISCAVCGSDDKTVLWYSEGSVFAKCWGCGVIYQNPQPIPGQLHKRYDQNYLKYELSNEEAFFNLMLLGLKDAKFYKYAGENGSQRSFLDIGCATGKLLKYMKGKDWKEKGVEVCKESAEYGRTERGLDIFTGTLQEAAFADSSYNVVHCSHLIEHLTDPAQFVSELYRILVPGGYAVITTPNASGLQAKLFGERWRSVIADHMYLFPKGVLKQLLSKKGFSVKKIKTWGGLGKGYAPDLVKRFADKLAKPFGFGDVMIMMAQKPEN